MKTLVIHVLGYRAIHHILNGSLSQIIEASKAVKNYNVRVVFQDNYSQDGTIEAVCKYPNIDILLSTENCMYTGGINRGLQYIEHRYQPDFVILADADNYCNPNAYQKLVEFMEKNTDVGMAQPIVVSKKDPSHIYSCGHQYIDGLFCRPIRELPKNMEQLLKLDSCSICSSIIRMDAFRMVGILNECFKIYYESSDLSFRVRKSGYKCACCLEAVAYNEGTVATLTENYHEAYYRMRNGLIFWYMHDASNYELMRNMCLEQYDKLNEQYEKNDYCTDCASESTRKGIIDGIKLCENNKPEVFMKMVPDIFEYDKSKLIVIQIGK